MYSMYSTSMFVGVYVRMYDTPVTMHTYVYV